MRVVTAYWKPDATQPSFSRCFDSSWVDKLARNVRKHGDHEVVVFTHEERSAFTEDVRVVRPARGRPGVHWLMEPYNPEHELGQVLFCGLDTVFLGPIDGFAVDADLAMIHDPFFPARLCTGVTVLRPSEKTAALWERYLQEPIDEPRYWAPPVGRRHFSDMEFLRVHAEPDLWLDEAFPGQILSYKKHVKPGGLKPDTKIVYFHGYPKQDRTLVSWVWENWR